MQLGAVGAERRDHGFESKAPRAPDRESGHHILGIVRATELRLGKLQDWLLSKQDPTVP